MDTLLSLTWLCFLVLAPVGVVSSEMDFYAREELKDFKRQPMERSSPEGVLLKYLMERYSKHGGGRPVLNYSQAVLVKFEVQLIQIVDLDEKNQVLKLNLWTNYEWKDEIMTWDPADFLGVDEIRVKSSQIWTPDIKLYNYADTRMEERRDALCIVSYDGNVTWIPQGIYMSSCDIDVTTFPFDKQECSLKFGSWTHTKRLLDLDFKNNPAMTTDDYFVENKAWSVIGAPGNKNEFKYVCCPEVYVDITYTVKFRRSATFYIYILILPCVLLTSLTLVLFWIPPESPTKMSLGMGIYMAFFVLLLLFEGNMPPASDNMPVLGTYFCFNMSLITASIFLNVFVPNLAFYGARSTIPKLLKKVMFAYIARVLRMDPLVRPFLEADKKRLIPIIPGMGLSNGGSNLGKSWASNDILRRKEEIDLNPQLASIDIILTEIRDLILEHKERIDEKDRKDRIAKEWKALGLIFDRMFFWIDLVIIISSLSVVMSLIFLTS